jgi:Peptidase family M28
MTSSPAHSVMRAVLGVAVRGAGHGMMRPPRLSAVPASAADVAEQAAESLGDGVLRALVEEFSGPRDRLHAAQAMQRTEDALVAALSGHGLQGGQGFQVRRQAFTETQVEGYGDGGRGDRAVYPRLDGVNVIAAKPGSEDSSKAVVVVAHYDTVRDSPGADDNTASVVTLLHLARILGPYQFRHPIVLAATDLEERGYFGARHLVRELRTEYKAIIGINLECIAYTCGDVGSQRLARGLDLLYPGQVRRLRRDGLRGDFTCVLYNQPARRTAALFGGALARFGSPEPVLMREPTGLPLLGPVLRARVPGVRQFTRSDHIAFWEAGLPAIQITDTADLRSPHYHQPSDTADRLDYSRLRSVIMAGASVVAAVAGVPRATATAGAYRP